VHILRILLAHGADINAIGYCQTPLQTATMWGQTKNVRMLIDAGADVNLVSGPGFARIPPLQFALMQGRLDLVRMLLHAKADIRAVSGGWTTALEIAAARGHEEIVKLLLDLGGQISPRR
jgi:ankyrin repeat protein